MLDRADGDDMTELALPPLTGFRAGYFATESGCYVIVTTPAARPDLWSEYLRGALQTYRGFGVEQALDYPATATGRSTSIFFVALDERGDVVAGSRVQGPMELPDDAHVTTEWSEAEDRRRLRHRLAARIPQGVIEMRAGWVDKRSPAKHALGSVIARSVIHSLHLLDVRYAVCSAATHALSRWTTTGGHIDETVEPAAYPDDRYLSSLMWWDSTTFADRASADQLSSLLDERAQLEGADSHAGLGVRSRALGAAA